MIILQAQKYLGVNSTNSFYQESVVYHLPSLNNKMIKHYTLPIVIHQENEFFIAECPLFNVASHGLNLYEAIESVKGALKLYLSSNKIQEKLPDEITYSKEDVLKKAEDLFKEYNLPEEKLPQYIYTEIELDVLLTMNN